jgi:hypothetical protein
MEEIIIGKPLTVLDHNDINIFQWGTKYGISTYKDIFIFWDPEKDARVVDLINSLNEHQLESLLAVGKHSEDEIRMIWSDDINITLPLEFKRRKFKFDIKNYTEADLKENTTEEKVD